MSNGFRSAHRNFRYRFNTLYRRVIWGRIFSSGYIDFGFHSYISKKDLSQIPFGMCIECYIPKGAKYYINPDLGEYVSNKIFIKDKP